MNKQEFVSHLESKLRGLPENEVRARIGFYSEMIDDRIEDGLSEEEAIADLGNTDEIASQIIADIPLSKIVKNKITPVRKLRAWEIILIALGAPLWIPLLITAFALLFTAYAVLWTLVAVAWSVFAAFAGSSAATAAGIILIATGNSTAGFILIASGLVVAGLAIFSFFGCTAATKGSAILSKKIAIGIKNLFVKKEAE